MRYAITLCYDGSDFYGFQRQKDYVTVQSEVEDALRTKLQEPIVLHASGRTDAGVHALAQVAHFDCEKELDCKGFGYAVNTLLPRSIAITDCRRVPDTFHARFDALRKTYLYRVYLSKIHSPLHRKYFHVCFYDLDLDVMDQACKYFIGEHDFRSFMLSGAKVKTTVRTVYDLHIERNEGGKQLDIFITGNGFLHNMVRAIAGTLIDVGRGRFPLESVPEIIAACDRRRAGKTLDGCGLYLCNVEYGDAMDLSDVPTPDLVRPPAPQTL